MTFLVGIETVNGVEPRVMSFTTHDVPKFWGLVGKEPKGLFNGFNFNVDTILELAFADTISIE